MNNMPDTITVGVLIGLLIGNGIDSKAAIMTDSGWECDETEVDAIYYNPKKPMYLCLPENLGMSMHMPIVMIGNFYGNILNITRR